MCSAWIMDIHMMERDQRQKREKFIRSLSFRVGHRSLQPFQFVVSLGTHELHWKCQWHSGGLLHHTRPFPFHPWPPIMPDPMHINYGTLRQNDWGLCCTPIKRCFVGNTAATNYMQSRLSLCATPTKSKGCRAVGWLLVIASCRRGSGEQRRQSGVSVGTWL